MLEPMLPAPPAFGRRGDSEASHRGDQRQLSAPAAGYASSASRGCRLRQLSVAAWPPITPAQRGRAAAGRQLTEKVTAGPRDKGPMGSLQVAAAPTAAAPCLITTRCARWLRAARNRVCSTDCLLAEGVSYPILSQQ